MDILGIVTSEVKEAFNLPGQVSAKVQSLFASDPEVQSRDLNSRSLTLDSLASQASRSAAWLSSLGTDPKALVNAWKRDFLYPALSMVQGNAQGRDDAFFLATQAAQELTDRINRAWALVSAQPTVSDYAGAAVETFTDAAKGASRVVSSVASETPDLLKYASWGLVAVAVIYGLNTLRMFKRAAR